jgi:hypothetical protein
MPLPVGFKVNGLKVTTSRLPVPPRIQKALIFLDSLPMAELLTSAELSEQLGRDIHNGQVNSSRILLDYREKVDNKLFWGSRKSIAQLRKQLAETEEPHD